jgi:hypothetical protein
MKGGSSEDRLRCTLFSRRPLRDNGTSNFEETKEEKGANKADEDTVSLPLILSFVHGIWRSKRVYLRS